MGEPGGLPSMGSHRVRHDWSNLAAAAGASTEVVFFHSLLKNKSYWDADYMRMDDKRTNYFDLAPIIQRNFRHMKNNHSKYFSLDSGKHCDIQINPLI